MAKRAWSEINIDENPSIEGSANKVITPAESSEVGTGHWTKEPKQLVETVPDKETPVLELVVETEVEVASEEELTAGVFWDLLHRAGYTMW